MTNHYKVIDGVKFDCTCDLGADHVELSGLREGVKYAIASLEKLPRIVEESTGHKHSWKCVGCDARMDDLDKFLADRAVLEASSNGDTSESQRVDAHISGEGTK